MKHISTAAGIALLVLALGLAAMREYTLFGAISVFFLLLSLTIPLYALTGRIFTTSLLVAVSLVALDVGDKVKYVELRQHLHHQDLGIIARFIGEMNIGFFEQYSKIAAPVAAGLVIFAILAVLVWRREKALMRLPSRLAFAFVLAAAAAVPVNSFMTSEYFRAVGMQMPARVAADKKPLRVSAALVSLSESLALSATLAKDRATFPASPSERSGAACVTCPDIILIHLESVYDPKFEEDYADMPPLAELVGRGMEKWHTLAQVHTWGGNSVVTEFELVCSLNHELFGWGGLQPHINVSPHFDGCLGKELKAIGYRTHVLYSLNGSFSNVREAFEKYGFNDFRDFAGLGLPTEWKDLHDRLIYAHLTEEMKEDRKGPRAFFASTNWNHGPHGLGLVTEAFKGPYDPGRAKDPALADYVNRLNDSIAGLDDLLATVRALPYPVVVLAYGDHHPAFAKHYADATLKAFSEPDYVTPLMMFRNFAGPAVEMKEAVTIEDTAFYLSRFAGLPPLTRIDAIQKIQQGCGGDQRNCSDKDKSRLRSVQLAGHAS